MTVSETTPEPEPTLAEAVGRVVMAAAWLEYELANAIVVLSGSNATGLLVQGQPFAALRDMLANIAVVAEEPTRIKFRALAKRISGLMEKRNEVAHAVWLPGRGDGVHVAERKRRSDRSVNTWTVPTLLALVDELRAASDELLVLADATSRDLYPDDPWLWGEPLSE